MYYLTPEQDKAVCAYVAWWSKTSYVYAAARRGYVVLLELHLVRPKGKLSDIVVQVPP